MQALVVHLGGDQEPAFRKLHLVFQNNRGIFTLWCLKGTIIIICESQRVLIMSYFELSR